MKTALEIELSFEQILSIVRQMPKDQKIKLSRELEKEEIDFRLSKLLKNFETQELDMKTITEETEAVRQEIYDQQKR
jgi:hypothetical protein